MPKKGQQGDFISRAGTGMTVVAWIIFLAMLLVIFDRLLSQRNNPNQNIVTKMAMHSLKYVHKLPLTPRQKNSLF